MDRVLNQGEQGGSIRERMVLRQAELDTLMETLRDEVDMWNLRIECLIESGNIDEVGPLAAEAVKCLDQKWPFHRHELHVSGTWHVNDVEATQDGLTYDMQERTAFDVKPSNGFAVYGTETGQPPRIGLSFIHKHLGLMNAAIQGNFDVLAFADPSKVSLYYVRPNTQESAKTEVGSVAEQLEYYDKLLQLHYLWGNSEFYRKPAHEQQRFLDGLTDRINDALPAPGVGVPIVCDLAEVPYIYRHIEGENGIQLQKLSAEADDVIMLEGSIVGFTILESFKLNNGEPIKTPHELVERDAGICMILKVEDGNVPEEFTDKPLLIPTRAADTCDITIY